MKKNQIAAIFAAVILLCTILFSYTFLIENVHHDCTGDENCPICMELQMAMQTISNLKILPILPVILAVLCVFTQIDTSKKFSNCIKNTLISLKVELLI